MVKIEQREGGDVSRAVGPYFLGEGDSHFFQSLNRNKKSLTLDLKHPRGQEVLHRLAATADGLMGNLRGDQPEKLGMTYEFLKHANPRIVCAHLSAYGRDGARKGWPGYDYLMQGEAGYLSLTGEPDGPPARMGLSVVDYSTGTTCALALLAGILEARRTGRGRDLDVSLYDVAMHQLNYPAAWYLNEGLVTGRAPRSAHPFIAPSQLLPHRRRLDLRHGADAALLGAAVRRPRARGPEDREFRDFAARREHRDELTGILDEEFSKQKTEYWLKQLQRHGSLRSGVRLAAGARESLLPRARRGAGVRSPGRARASSWWRARSASARRCRRGRRRSSGSIRTSCCRSSDTQAMKSRG